MTVEQAVMGVLLANYPVVRNHVVQTAHPTYKMSGLARLRGLKQDGIVSYQFYSHNNVYRILTPREELVRALAVMERGEMEVMGEGKRKYTMSEAALKARKETAIKAGAKRSRTINKEGYVLPPNIIPCCSECGVKCTEAETFDIKERLCGKCGPDIKGPVQAKEWEETGTKRPGDELRIALDFTEHPELYKELMDLARYEMRTPEAQILYLLKYGNFDALKH